MHYTDYTPV
jgi:hypothetical protein